MDLAKGSGAETVALKIKEETPPAGQPGQPGQPGEAPAPGAPAPPK